MTTQQSIDDILAALAHHLRQLDRDARSWERQAKDWEQQCTAHRATIDQYRGALDDLLTGAEQQSQSDVDVAAKCRAALAGRGPGTPLP